MTNSREIYYHLGWIKYNDPIFRLDGPGMIYFNGVELWSNYNPEIWGRTSDGLIRISGLGDILYHKGDWKNRNKMSNKMIFETYSSRKYL